MLGVNFNQNKISGNKSLNINQGYNRVIGDCGNKSLNINQSQNKMIGDTGNKSLNINQGYDRVIGDCGNKSLNINQNHRGTNNEDARFPWDCNDRVELSF